MWTAAAMTTTTVRGSGRRLGRAAAAASRHGGHHLRRSLATQLLSDGDRAKALQDLSAKYASPFLWEEDPDRNAIRKTFVFRDFAQAWMFLSGAALRAEAMDHHPEWSNVYNRVDVTLTTHDAGGVSRKDLQLAVYMEDLAAQLLPGKRPT